MYIKEKKCCQDPTDCIPDIQNTDEYYEFVKDLQSLSSFPPYEVTDKSVYIVRRLSVGFRKMKLGVGLIKEQSRSNLACFEIDSQNNIIRALAPDGVSRYNVLDNESVIMGVAGLLKEKKSPNTQVVNNFYVTVFPLQVEIAQIIYKNKNLVTAAFYQGGTIESVISDYAVNPNVLIKRTIVNGKGDGSGIGTTTTVGISNIPAQPAKIECDFQLTLQYPAVSTIIYDVTPLPVNSYKCFQTIFIGSQRNMWAVTLDNDETVLDEKILTFQGNI